MNVLVPIRDKVVEPICGLIAPYAHRVPSIIPKAWERIANRQDAARLEAVRLLGSRYPEAREAVASGCCWPGFAPGLRAIPASERGAILRRLFGPTAPDIINVGLDFTLRPDPDLGAIIAGCAEISRALDDTEAEPVRCIGLPELRGIIADDQALFDTTGLAASRALAELVLHGEEERTEGYARWLLWCDGLRRYTDGPFASRWLFRFLNLVPDSSGFPMTIPLVDTLDTFVEALLDGGRPQAQLRTIAAATTEILRQGAVPVGPAPYGAQGGFLVVTGRLD